MNPKKIKYGTREYKEAYENNQVVNSYNGDTYEVSLPEVLITPRNNLDLGQVVRNGTSKLNMTQSLFRNYKPVLATQ